MLRLESISILQTSIKCLPPLGNSLAPGAPHNYVLAHQAQGLLYLHSVGLEQIYTQTQLRSLDTLEGEMYLWPLADLKVCLEQLDSSYAIQIEKDLGSLSLKTYVEVVDNLPQVLDTTYLNTFGGSFDEFDLLDPGSKLNFFYTSINVLDSLQRAASYGDYSNRTGGDRAVLLNVEVEKLQIYSIPQAAPNFYLAQEVKTYNTNITESKELAILGCHLTYLLTYFNEKTLLNLEWTIYEHWLEIKSENKLMRIPLQNIDRFNYLKPVSSSFNVELGSLVTGYTVPLSRAISAAKAQQATKSNNRFIRITEQNQKLRLGKVSDLLQRDWSEIEIWTYDNPNKETLPAVSINGPALLKCLLAFESYLKKTELSFNLQVSFWRKTIGKLERWIVEIRLDTDQTNHPIILASVNITQPPATVSESAIT
jgi:hypothetical protein